MGGAGQIRVSSRSLPRLRPEVRLAYDEVSGRIVLLHPEAVAFLNATTGTILELVDGRTTVGSISATLQQRFDGVNADDDAVLPGCDARPGPAHRQNGAPPRQCRAGLPIRTGG